MPPFVFANRDPINLPPLRRPWWKRGSIASAFNGAVIGALLAAAFGTGSPWTWVLLVGWAFVSVVLKCIDHELGIG